MAPPPQTPTRRSKRGQPITDTKNFAKDKGVAASVAWNKNPVHVRPIDPALDLTDDENEAWAKEEEEDKGDLKTRIYTQFQKPSAKAAFRPAKGKKAASRRSDGMETYNIGDTVLISTYSISVRKVPSVAVIVGMWETDFGDEESRKKVRIHWFIRPKELAGIRAKRETLPDEIYYSIASDAIVSPSAIISHCTVTTAQRKKSPSKKPSSPTKNGWKYFDASDVEESELDQFQCLQAVNSHRGIYYEFDWTSHRESALLSAETLGASEAWNVEVADQVSVPQGRKTTTAKSKARQPSVGSDDVSENDEDFEAEDAEEDSDEDQDDIAEEEPPSDPEDEEEDDHPAPRTPRKRKPKQDPFTTPRKRAKKTIAQPTPHSKAALSRRAKPKKSNKFTNLPLTNYSGALSSMKGLAKDPWLRAMHVLHVGSRPDELPCRGAELKDVLTKVGDLLEEGSGGCVYISGVPGTGKTATVHASIRELKRLAEESEINPFTYVEINGLRIPEPTAAYTLLWEAISGHDTVKDGPLRTSAKESLKELTRYFSGGRRSGPGEHACVVLMDELDQLVTTKQDVVYNFFNWPMLTGSKLVVIAVANTMDLPERVMNGRVRSRIGQNRVDFRPYSTDQLQEIVQTRLNTSREGLPANTPEVMKSDAIRMAAMKVAAVSGDARRVLDVCRRVVELVKPNKRTAKIADVNEVIKLMQNSPTAAYLRDCSFHERMMLASLVKCTKREGVDEIKWEEVRHQHMIYLNALSNEDDSSRKPTANEVAMVLHSLVSSRAVLMEEGAAVIRKPEGERKLMLNLEINEVQRVLAEAGKTWATLLGN
ncbi:P-loop containing nucleoside triphosphate hydrolase protein, partial [Mycena floridula]